MDQEIQKRMMNIMKKAIQSERIAHKRYTLCVSYADTDEEKKIFSDLAEEEMKHEELLMGKLREMKKAMGLEIMKKEKTVEAPKKSKKAKKKEKKEEKKEE